MDMIALQPTPLAQHHTFQSDDIDETREQIAQVFCAHQLLAARGARFDARHHYVSWRDVSFSYLRYGAEVEIRTDAPEDFFLFQMPLVGGATVEAGPYRSESDVARPVMINPHFALSQRWHSSSEHIMLRIRRDAMEDHAYGLIGACTLEPLTFAPIENPECPKIAALRRMILYLISEIDQGRFRQEDGGLMAAQMEKALMSGLIEAIPNSYRDLIGARAREITPRKLRQAEHYIFENLGEKVTLTDIAHASGTTPRNLQQIFQQFRGVSPMQMLRKRRLTAARERLMNSADGASVTEVAASCGFTHLGRFSVIYREEFGETPSTTLDQGLKCRRGFAVPRSRLAPPLCDKLQRGH